MVPETVRKCRPSSVHQHASVPKVTINEYRQTTIADDHVRPTSEQDHVSLESEAPASQGGLQALFGYRIFSPNGAHPGRDAEGDHRDAMLG